ncbi:hypothetical protein FSP39_014779 [Pinctada imbricata]|uniref:G/T mismatch-specific thymine DNA glycosylase n=1 Tax=Pinctada imbricata TaxID=66713 RepID=A0AA88YK85_PINIB|nr:hypothetical protein FSP39_014779 [Pinctada imbricata]
MTGAELEKGRYDCSAAGLKTNVRDKLQQDNNRCQKKSVKMYTADGFQPIYYNDGMPHPPGMMMSDNVHIKPDPDAEPPKTPKKRGPKKKRVKQEEITDHMAVKKRKRDRFNGMTEDEVMQKGLPDHLQENLDIVIVGINPGLCAAYVGHHYAGPGNHFWKCMFLSGLIPEPFNAYDDYKLTKYGIGFTNIVARTTRGSSDLTRKEIKEGSTLLIEKIKQYKPKIAVFNGKGIYEVFVGHKNFAIGKQPDKLEGTDTVVFVMPSSSARCSQLPRAVDKVPFYAALKKLRDHLKGDLETLDDAEVCFPDLELKVVKKEPKPEAADEESCANVSKYFMPNGQMNNTSAADGEQYRVNHCNNFMTVKQENTYGFNDYGGNAYNCDSRPMSYNMNQGKETVPQGSSMYDNSSQVVPSVSSAHCYQDGNNFHSQGPYPHNDFQMQPCMTQQMSCNTGQPSQQQMMMNQHSSYMNGPNQDYQRHYQTQLQSYQYQQYGQNSATPVQTNYMSQSFTQAPGFTQAMSMQMHSQFQQQNERSFSMQSQAAFRMSMSTHNAMGWQGQQGMVKQESYDWSNGCNGGMNPCGGPSPNGLHYDGASQGQGQGSNPQQSFSQGTSPLQHLQNLSQGLNMDLVPQRPNSQQSSYSSSPRQCLTPGTNASPMGSPLNMNSPSTHNNRPTLEMTSVKQEPSDYSSPMSCPYQGNMGT